MKLKSNKKSSLEIKAKYINFILFNNNVPASFNDLSDFTTKTGVSAVVAKDLLDGNTPYYKQWTKHPN